MMLLGATLFWGPVTLVNIFTRKELSVALGTLLSSSSFLLGYFLLRREFFHSVRSISVWMFLGLFLFGGVFSLVAFTAMGAGLSGLQGWEMFMLLLASFVPGWFALYGSLTLGTLPALLLLAVLTVFLHGRLEQKQPTKENP